MICEEVDWWRAEEVWLETDLKKLAFGRIYHESITFFNCSLQI